VPAAGTASPPLRLQGGKLSLRHYFVRPAGRLFFLRLFLLLLANQVFILGWIKRYFKLLCIMVFFQVFHSPIFICFVVGMGQQDQG
jgi:hypothetical protein